MGLNRRKYLTGRASSRTCEKIVNIFQNNRHFQNVNDENFDAIKTDLSQTIAETQTFYQCLIDKAKTPRTLKVTS